MSALSNITSIRIPRKELDVLQRTFRAAGMFGNEAVGFLAGRHRDESEFIVSNAIVPLQRTFRDDSGGCGVVLEGETLFQMNKLLHRERLTLVAQVHSHPTKAFHSDVDDQYAIMTREGGLSIVVPDFGAADNFLSDWAVYRLRNRDWVALTVQESQELLRID